MPGQPLQRQDSPFLTRLPAEIRVMIYEYALPGRAIHLSISAGFTIAGTICLVEPQPVTDLVACSGCFRAGAKKVYPRLLALPVTCRQVCVETLPIYRSKIFILCGYADLLSVYRSLAVFSSWAGMVSRLKPFRRLHVDLGYAKGCRSADHLETCLQAVVKNEPGAQEICLLFRREYSHFIHRFPLMESTILTLSKLRGLTEFRLIFLEYQAFQDEYLHRSPAMLTWMLNFHIKVKVVEGILRDFACLGVDGGVSGLDQASREMTESDDKFLRGLNAKMKRVLLEKYGFF